jgi:hypothetical protein
MKSRLEADVGKDTYVTIQISGKANNMLNGAVSRSGRTKKQEARVRLEDHLTRYQCISEVNNATKFED